MRLRHRLHLALPAAVVLGFGLFAGSLTWQVPAVKAASGPIDAQASELVRLMNGARAAEGKAALKWDPFLASKARDGAIPCPDDAQATIAGRAKDFATYNNMSHQLRLCDASSYELSSTLFVSVLQNSWSYWDVGEIDLVNGGYGNGAFLYTYAGTKTWQSWTYATTGHAMMGWKTSSSHWNIIMGKYDRVGCGGWANGTTYYYDCAFSVGGSSPNGLRSASTKSPFSNPVPTIAPTPTPKPTLRPTPRPTVAPAVHKTAAPTPCKTQTAPPIVCPIIGQSGVVPSASPSPSPTGASSASASATDPVATTSPTEEAALVVPLAEPSDDPQNAQAAGLQQIVADGSGPADGASGWPAAVARFVALAAASMALFLSGCSMILSSRRRRRGRNVDDPAVRFGPPAD